MSFLLKLKKEKIIERNEKIYSLDVRPNALGLGLDLDWDYSGPDLVPEMPQLLDAVVVFVDYFDDYY